MEHFLSRIGAAVSHIIDRSDIFIVRVRNRQKLLLLNSAKEGQRCRQVQKWTKSIRSCLPVNIRNTVMRLLVSLNGNSDLYSFPLTVVVKMQNYNQTISGFFFQWPKINSNGE